MNLAPPVSEIAFHHNEQAYAFVDRLVETGHHGPCYLFWGPQGVGKRRCALYFAQKLLSRYSSYTKTRKGQHPDLHLYYPEGKACLHPIEKMRQLKVEAYLNPLESQKKVFIIFEADKMLPSSANALLKVFEEPPEDSLFILLTQHIHSILPTILSRCQKLPFYKLCTHQMKQELEKSLGKGAEAQIALSLSQGSGQKASILASSQHFFSLRKPLIELIVKENQLPYGLLVDLKEPLERALVERLKKCLFHHPELTLKPDDSLSLQELYKRYEEALISQYTLEFFQDICWLYLAFYRDVLVYQKTSDKECCFHSDCKLALQDLKAKEPYALFQKAEKKVARAKLALQRHIKLFNCFESLFL